MSVPSGSHLKRTLLTIDVEHTRPASQNDSKATARNSAQINAAVSYTPDPDPNYTFGAPNPTTIRFHQPPQTHHEEARRRRYSRAEESLATTAQRVLSETSARELQIKALREATAVFNREADTARERAAQFKTLLHECNGKDREALQQERWREERRLALVKDQIQSISKQLVALCTPTSAQQHSAESSPSSPSSQKTANLLRFLQLSHSRQELKRKQVANDNDKLIRARRVTVSEVSCLQLTPASPSLHTRSRSLDLPRINITLPPMRVCPAATVPSPSSNPRDSAGSTYAVSPLASVPESTFEREGSNDEDEDDASLATAESQDLLPPFDIPSKADRHLDDANEGGTALIQSPYALRARSTAELMAELPPSSLPSYALDLLDDFESVGEQPRLSLDRIRSRGPRPSKEWEILPVASSPDLHDASEQQQQQQFLHTSPLRKTLRRPMSMSFFKASAPLTVIPESAFVPTTPPRKSVLDLVSPKRPASSPAYGSSKASKSERGSPRKLRAKASLRRLFS